MCVGSMFCIPSAPLCQSALFAPCFRGLKPMMCHRCVSILCVTKSDFFEGVPPHKSTGDIHQINRSFICILSDSLCVCSYLVHVILYFDGSYFSFRFNVKNSTWPLEI